MEFLLERSRNEAVELLVPEEIKIGGLRKWKKEIILCEGKLKFFSSSPFFFFTFILSITLNIPL